MSTNPSHTPPFPYQRGQQTKGETGSTRQSLTEGRCGRPAFSLKLDVQAYQIREGCVRGQLVQCDRVAIAVVIKTATRPASMSDV